MNCFRFTILLWSISALSQAQSQTDFASAALSAKQDLDRAQAALTNQREVLAKEKVPLVNAYNQRLAEVTKYRQQVDSIRRSRENAAFDLGALERRVQAWRDEDQYIASLLEDYAQQFESGVTLSELAHYQDAIQSNWNEQDLPPADRLQKQLSMIQTGISRLQELLGGSQFEEKILSESGEVLPGTFTIFGPLAVFNSKDDTAHGLAVEGKNLRPNLYAAKSSKHVSAIKSVTGGAEGAIPVDITMGTALELSLGRDSLWHHLRKGGFWVLPILLLGAISTVLAILKWRQLQGITPLAPTAVREALQRLRDGAPDDALERIQSLKHPAAPLLKCAIEHADAPKELVEEVIYESWLEAQPPLQKWLPVLSVTAATAPLLGLLGTVTGMISTFGLIHVFGTGDAQNLSGGISEALITTEIGLVVAIPALLAHAYLNRRVQGIIASMEKAGLTFLNGLPLKPLTDDA
jgi:biopolymer transport protein ExbB